MIPGSFGDNIRASRVRQAVVQIDQLNTIAWESSLEVARRCLAPTAPSRLSCIFACLTFEEAHDFRRRFRPGAFVFECSIPDNTPVHIADFEAITTTIAGKSFLDTFVDAALVYWTGAQHSTLREVIVGGEVTIVAKLPLT